MVYLINSPMPAKIEISHKTVIFTVAFLLSLWFLYQIREIIFLVFVSFILMSAFKPWADFLEKFHIPRVISALLIYLVIISVLIFGASSILPSLVTQSIRLGESLPSYLKTAAPFLKIDYSLFTREIAPLGENMVKVTIGIFSNMIALFTLVIISFYLLIERKHLAEYLSGFTKESNAHKWVAIVAKIEKRLGDWVRGQLMLAFTIGLATFIGLSLIGIPFSLSLAILAGILEIIPFIGPIIAAIPAVLVASTGSAFLALITIAVYFVIQQLEAHLVVPLVMNKTVGLPPLVTIISLLIGAKIAGVGGALLAIPLVVAGSTLVAEYIKLRDAH